MKGLQQGLLEGCGYGLWWVETLVQLFISQAYLLLLLLYIR
jgi:hypothetical protein